VGGVPAFTDLAALPVAQLAALREALQGRGADVDVDLLEAYLDVAAPDWRDPAGAQRQISASGSATDDPYEILGVARNAPLEVVTRAYRSAAQALHPDKGHSKWFTQVLGTAYRKVKEDRQGDPQ
jgi:DnaJ-domain-containing protein 1